VLCADKTSKKSALISIEQVRKSWKDGFGVKDEICWARRSWLESSAIWPGWGHAISV